MFYNEILCDDKSLKDMQNAKQHSSQEQFIFRSLFNSDYK
jgi:hypothetical protein